MKRSILFKAGLIASVCFMAVNASAAGTSGGTITFNGKITSSTCDSALEGSAANEVTIPDVATNAFTGDTAGRTSFSILLTSCVLDKDTGVAAYFEPDANWVDMDTGHLNNIAVIARDGGFDYCPVFDQGAGLLSNVMYNPFEIIHKSLIAQAKARPFQTTFNRQIHTMESLYGKQLEIPDFTRTQLAQ